LYGEDEVEMCLFVKEDARDNLKDALSTEPIPGLSKVIGLQKLRKKYARYEDRRKLCAGFDLFLCDDRILPLMPKALGKTFFEKKKHPIPVKVTGKSVHKCITKARDSTYFYLGWGPCSAVRIAKTTMTVDEVVENIMAGVKAVVEHIPKKMKGIQAIHIKTEDSIALPIYNSLAYGMKIDAWSTTAGSNNKKRVASEASTTEEEEPAAEPSAKRAKPTKAAKQPKQLELTNGEELLAERNGEYEAATLIGASAKKEGQWKVKFASDGKVFARPESELKPAEEEDEEEGEDEEGMDSDGSLDMEEIGDDDEE
jgi:ribosomal protein L1